MSISFQINWFFLAAFTMILVGYTIFIYRTTIPEISKPKKILLTFLRITVLVLLFLLIFEPLLRIEKNKIIQPIHYFFVDNSKSLNQFEDKTPLISNSFLNELKKLPSNSFRLFSFGSKVSDELKPDSIHFSFTEPGTNLSKIFESLQEKENISSVTILSDGIFTEGSNPQYLAEKLNVAVFAVGVGDSTTKKDLSIQKILSNEYLYAGINTQFWVSVFQTGYRNSKATLSLLEDNSLQEVKEISFTDNEQQNVEFAYKPKTPGEKKISFVLSPLPGEYSTENNRKSLFVKILDSKLSVVLLAGAPSADVTFIKNSLQADTNNAVQSFTQITSSQFLEKKSPEGAIDKADILYLVNFPTSQTSNQLIEKVAKLINEKSLPYFFLLTSSVDPVKLRLLQNELPFIINRTDKGVVEVQPAIPDEMLRNTLLQFGSKNILGQWNNLPPVSKPNWEITAKPECEILAKTKINNITLNSPLMITKRLGSKRSIAVLAGDIWKWKLQKATEQLDLFDRFLANGTKWLRAVDQKKQVSLSTNKKFYSLGEKIHFTAEIYDESFNQVNDAEIKCSIKNKEIDLPVSFSSVGNGLYEGEITEIGKGDYNFSGNAFLNNKSLGKDGGRFSVGDIDYELQNTTMNSDLLNLLALETKGKFFYNSYKGLFAKLNEISNNSSKNKIEVNEYRLWSSETMLVILVFLFAAEWFLRKREGLL